jgi:hypothetical protein
MSRTEALSLLQTSPYPDKIQMLQDREFVMKKLGFTEETFDSYIRAPMVGHENYGTERPQWDFLKRAHQLLGLKRG